MCNNANQCSHSAIYGNILQSSVKWLIERELEIIGEAANRLLKIDSSIPIDNVRKIVDLRNWVIHGYDKVDDVIIWGIISKQLPLLKIQIDRLLKY